MNAVAALDHIGGEGNDPSRTPEPDFKLYALSYAHNCESKQIPVNEKIDRFNVGVQAVAVVPLLMECL